VSGPLAIFYKSSENLLKEQRELVTRTMETGATLETGYADSTGD
jgi:hypothetical protein